MLFLQGCSADQHSTFNGYFLSDSHFRTTNTHTRTHADISFLQTAVEDVAAHYFEPLELQYS